MPIRPSRADSTSFGALRRRWSASTARLFSRRRLSDTLSYELSQGEVSEQALYDRTTDYMREYYNRAKFLNRSAARLAISVFQRRLASSTYALTRSFERRLAKLDGLIEDVRAGRLTTEQLLSLQERLRVRDIEEDKTADEEQPEDGLEENEAAELAVMAGVVGVTLGDLETERNQVRDLLDLARKVSDRSEDSKFEKLREVIRDPQWRDNKILVFTEHRDTLNFIVRTSRRDGLRWQSCANPRRDGLPRAAGTGRFLRPCHRRGRRGLYDLHGRCCRGHQPAASLLDDGQLRYSLESRAP